MSCAHNCKIEIERSNIDHKICTFIRCHELDLESVHSTYVVQAVEHEGFGSMLLRLQEETVLTNQVHAEELAYLQKTIMNLRARLADTASHQVHGSVSKWKRPWRPRCSKSSHPVPTEPRLARCNIVISFWSCAFFFILLFPCSYFSQSTVTFDEIMLCPIKHASLNGRVVWTQLYPKYVV